MTHHHLGEFSGGTALLTHRTLKYSYLWNRIPLCVQEKMPLTLAVQLIRVACHEGRVAAHR